MGANFEGTNTGKQLLMQTAGNINPDGTATAR